jgi:hypothetical protein
VKNFFHHYKQNIFKKMKTKITEIKIAKTITPEGWTSENAFEYLGKEYNGRIMKGYKD